VSITTNSILSHDCRLRPTSHIRLQENLTPHEWPDRPRSANVVKGLHVIAYRRSDYGHRFVDQMAQSSLLRTRTFVVALTRMVDRIAQLAVGETPTAALVQRLQQPGL
jgi:hypothetical protein